MTSLRDVGLFHAEFDRHPGRQNPVTLRSSVDSDRPRFDPLSGSYVDIAPSVFFDDVEYVDTDKRAAVFFGERGGIRDLIAPKRQCHRWRSCKHR
ncbi:MAG: hypothetical protein R3A49_06290 [Acidimicrobiia bacterium]